jgi:hypothetical protein
MPEFIFGQPTSNDFIFGQQQNTLVLQSNSTIIIGPTGPTGSGATEGLPTVLSINNTTGTYSINNPLTPLQLGSGDLFGSGTFSLTYYDNLQLYSEYHDEDTNTGSLINLAGSNGSGGDGITPDARFAEIIAFDFNTGNYNGIQIFPDKIVTKSDNLSGTFSGIQYDQDYSAGFTNKSLINKGYADSHYLTQSIVNGLEQVLLIGNTFSTNTIVFDNSVTNNTTALYQDINTGIGYYIGIGDNIDLSNASNYALMSFYINNGIDILSNSGGININTPNDNIIINANRLVNITSGNGLVLQNNSTNAATYKSSGANNLISTSDTNIISNTNINLISNTINIATSSVINSYNGGGQLALDAGGVPGVIALTLDDQTYANAYLYLSSGDVDGYNNFIDLVANNASDNSVTAQVNVGIYSSDVGAYEAYMSFNNGNTSLNYKANQVFMTDGNTLIQPNFSNGSTGTIQLNGVGNMMRHKIINVATGSNPLDAVNVSQLNAATSSITSITGTSSQVLYFDRNGRPTSSSVFTYNNGVGGISVSATGSVMTQLALGYTASSYNTLNNAITPLLIKAANGLSNGGIKMQTSTPGNATDVFVVQDWGNNSDALLSVGSSIYINSHIGNNSYFGNKLAVGATINASALLYLGAGGSASSTAPLKFNGTSPVVNLLNILENGAVEFDGTNLYWTGTASGVQNRYKILGQTGSNSANQVPVFNDANQVRAYTNFTYNGTDLNIGANNNFIRVGGAAIIGGSTTTGTNLYPIALNQINFGDQTNSNPSVITMQLNSATSSYGMSIGFVTPAGSAGRNPSARLQIMGASGPGSAPLKLTATSSNPLLTTPESGAIETDGLNLYFTDSSPVRHKILSMSGSNSGLANSIAYFDSINSLTASSNLQFQTFDNANQGRGIYINNSSNPILANYITGGATILNNPTNNTNDKIVFRFQNGADLFSVNKSASGYYGLFNVGGTKIGDANVPTAKLHIVAGGTIAGSAPLKLTGTSSLLSTTEAGAIEVDLNHIYYTATASGTRYQLDRQGLSNHTHTIFTPTTGQTVNLVNNQYNIINPAGALLALTLNLPSSPNNNDCVYIKFTQNITTVTYANGTVVDGITAPTAGGLTVLVYDTSTNSWY